MILKVSIEELIRSGKTEIKGVLDDKVIKPNIEVECTEDNILKGLSFLSNIVGKLKTNILHVSYKGSVDVLESALFSSDYSNIPIVLKKNLSEIEHVDLLLASMPKNVKVVVKIDVELDNIMKIVNDYSKKYSNISFCGKNLIALKGCRLGCTDKVIKDLTSEDGCYRGYKCIDIGAISDLEYVEATVKSEGKVRKVVKEPKVKEPKVKKEKVVKPKKESKPKKGVSSILAKRLSKGE